MGFWNKVKEATSQIEFKETFEKAKEIVNQIEIKEKLEKVGNSTSAQFARTQEWSSQKYEQYYPTIEEVVIRGLINVSEEKLKDEEFIESLFNKAFELLPTPIRLALPRQTFLGFCHTNKEKLLSKTIEYKTNKFQNSNNTQNIDAKEITKFNDH